MAGSRIRYNDIPTSGLMEFVCDTVNEVGDAPTTVKKGRGVFSNCRQCAPIGSTLIVGNEGGATLVYMLFSFGWKQL